MPNFMTKFQHFYYIKWFQPLWHVGKLMLKSLYIIKMLEFGHEIWHVLLILKMNTCDKSKVVSNSNIFIIQVDFSIDFQTIFWFFIQNEAELSSNFLVCLLLFIDLLKNLRGHSKQMGALGDVLGAQKIMGGLGSYNKNFRKFKFF